MTGYEPTRSCECGLFAEPNRRDLGDRFAGRGDITADRADGQQHTRLAAMSVGTEREADIIAMRSQINVKVSDIGSSSKNVPDLHARVGRCGHHTNLLREPVLNSRNASRSESQVREQLTARGNSGAREQLLQKGYAACASNKLVHPGLRFGRYEASMSGRVSTQSLWAIAAGSTAARPHHPASSPQRWTSRW